MVLDGEGRGVVLSKYQERPCRGKQFKTCSYLFLYAGNDGQGRHLNFGFPLGVASNSA